VSSESNKQFAKNSSVPRRRHYASKKSKNRKHASGRTNWKERFNCPRRQFAMKLRFLLLEILDPKRRLEQEHRESLKLYQKMIHVKVSLLPPPNLLLHDAAVGKPEAAILRSLAKLQGQSIHIPPGLWFQTFAHL